LVLPVSVATLVLLALLGSSAPLVPKARRGQELLVSKARLVCKE
jgi:hypothetical protein